MGTILAQTTVAFLTDNHPNALTIVLKPILHIHTEGSEAKLAWWFSPTLCKDSSVVSIAPKVKKKKKHLRLCMIWRQDPWLAAHQNRPRSHDKMQFPVPTWRE